MLIPSISFRNISLIQNFQSQNQNLDLTKHHNQDLTGKNVAHREIIKQDRNFRLKLTKKFISLGL